jgi:hypothetical protein
VVKGIFICFSQSFKLVISFPEGAWLYAAKTIKLCEDQARWLMSVIPTPWEVDIKR